MSKTKILRNSLYMTALLCGTGAMFSCSDDNNGDIDYKNGTPSFTIKATMSQDMIDLTHTIIFAQDPDGNVEAELLDSRTWEVSFTKDKTPASAGYAIYYYLKDEYDRKFVLLLLELGNKLNINTDFYKETFDKIMSPLYSQTKPVK